MKLRTVLAIVASSLGLATQATAAFPERDIEFVIPYNPGGGNDTIVRMIAPYIEKHLPGDVSVVPVNTPGAGGQRGATTVYRADPDGYTIGLFPMPGLALPGVLGETVEFDLEEMTWLGRLEASHYVLLVPATSDIQSLDDLGDGRDVTILSTGFGSTMLAASQIMAGALGIDAAYVTGYQSSSDAMAGLIRGDGNAAMGVIEPSASYVRVRRSAAVGRLGQPSSASRCSHLRRARASGIERVSAWTGGSGRRQILTRRREAFSRRR